MKIKPEDYKMLEDEILKLFASNFKEHDYTIDDYKNNYKNQGFTMKRFRWDVYHIIDQKNNYTIGRKLHSYLNDDHIDSVLKQITKTNGNDKIKKSDIESIHVGVYDPYNELGGSCQADNSQADNSQADNSQDNIQKMQDARLEKALKKVYRFDSGVMSLQDYINSHEFIRKSITIRNHSRRKMQGSHKRIKDQYSYTIWKQDDTGIDVPKLVYDQMDLPEKISDNRFD